MALKTERVTIGGALFTITQLGAVEGRGLYKKFVTAVGPLLREVVSGDSLTSLPTAFSGLTSGDTDQSNEAAVTVLKTLVPIAIKAVEQIPGDLFEELCEAFAPHCTVAIGKAAGGQAVAMPLNTVFDSHFAGEYQDMTVWLAQCIKVNGFLGKALRELGAAKASQPQPSPA